MYQCPSSQGPLQSVGSRSINWLSCGNWWRNRNFTGLQTLISWSFYPWFFCWYKLIGPLLAVLSILPLRTPCFINCVCHVHIIIIVTLQLLEVEYCFNFSSVAQLCPTLCNSMNRSTPGLPVHDQLPESTQIHVYRVDDAIQPSHPLSSPSPPALNLSQHQGLFQWVSSSHQVAIVLEFQLQHQSFQWTLRTDLL